MFDKEVEGGREPQGRSALVFAVVHTAWGQAGGVGIEQPAQHWAISWISQTQKPSVLWGVAAGCRL